MRIIWHARLAEREWIASLLSRIVNEEIEDLSFAWHGDNAIHIISGNETPLYSLHDWFNEVRARGQNITLFQVSDEWFSGGYRYYDKFDRVIRNHETWLARAPGILTLPLGLPVALSYPGEQIPAGTRKYVWSFAGEVKASRQEMVTALTKSVPHLVVDTSRTSAKLSRQNYISLLRDSKFAPCPMGNVMLETWRLYEALECGAIPLVERRSTLDYYKNLLGEHPIPTFERWNEAAALVLKCTQDAEKLRCLQRHINDWWKLYKERLRNEVAEFLASPSYSAELSTFAKQRQNGSTVLFRMCQHFELLRHQSKSSLLNRCKLTVERALNIGR